MEVCVANFVHRSKQELESLYVDAARRLVNAGVLYDLGHFGEAPDIAKEVANFVYDHGATRGLLSSMGLKETMKFTCSAIAPYVPDKGYLVSNEYYLITAPIGFFGMDYVANKGRNCVKSLSFTDWWQGNVLSRWDGGAMAREYITRSELVLHVRNKEGGGHVASGHHLVGAADKMVRLMSGEYVDGHVQIGDAEPATAEDNAPAYATLRQIGWELEETLAALRPDLWQLGMRPATPGPRMKPYIEE